MTTPPPAPTLPPDLLAKATEAIVNYRRDHGATRTRTEARTDAEAALRAERNELRERLAASEAKCDQIDNAYKIQINDDERSFDQWWKANEKGLRAASVEEVAYNAWLDAQDRERVRVEAEFGRLRSVIFNDTTIPGAATSVAIGHVDAAEKRLTGGGA